MTAAVPDAPLRLRLRGGGAVELGEDALLHPRSVRFGGSVRTPWAGITHVAAGPGGIRIGTRSGVTWLRRSDFAEPDGALRLAREIRDRAGRGPGGFERLERMARLDGLAARPGPARLGPALALACAAAFALQAADPAAGYAGLFSALLVRLGEPWRLVTANFLHASVGHLALNAVGLAALGALAERSLGSRAAPLVVAAAAAGAMGGCYAAGYENALGASGVVYGLAGALFWLELRAPGALPAGWRLPRRLFGALLALETVVLLGVPGIAHAAHAGGFVGGVLGAAAVGPRLAAEARPRRALAVANALAAAVVLLAAAAWARSVIAPDVVALARRAESLLAMDGVPPVFLNNEAWRIATARRLDPRALEVAERLAERAADETRWADPAVLDTLAEIHFASGRSDLALRLADAAVALAPDEPYYREQRRRFAGEGGAGGRPRGPAQRREREPAPRGPAEPEPGLRV